MSASSRAAWRPSRSTPTWCATSRSAACEFWRQALARVAALPGVAAAAIVSPTLPFTFNFNKHEMRIDNRTYVEGQRGEIIENVAVSPGYLATLGVPLRRGPRHRRRRHRTARPGVAVVNETMARRFWPNESAVGHTLQVVDAPSATFRVVGVVADHKRHGVLEAAVALRLLRRGAAAEPLQLPARAHRAATPTTLLAAMRRELLAMEPGLVFMDASTMDANTWRRR